MLTLTVEDNYICFLSIQEFTTTTYFGPICGPSSGCGWTFSLGYTNMRVMVLGRNGTGSRSHYVTGFHGHGCIWLDIVFSPTGIISYARGYDIIHRYNYLSYNMYNQ